MSNISVVKREILEEMYRRKQRELEGVTFELESTLKNVHLADDMYLDMERRLNEANAKILQLYAVNKYLMKGE